jgi:hypothetical protein
MKLARTFLVLALCLAAHIPQTFAAQSGALIPYVRPQYFTNAGVPVALGYVCTYAAGTTTPLATYSDAALGSALPNPIRLNAAGRPQTGGGVESDIYLSAAVYKINLYAAGIGNTCNGAAVGALIWSQDNVSSVAQFVSAANLNNVRLCENFPGADEGEKIAACIADLPSTGGTADARGFEGTQAIAADPFTGVTKPVTVQLGAATVAVATNLSIPSTITLDIGSGGSLVPGSGVVITTNGPIVASSQFFSGAGSLVVAGGIHAPPTKLFANANVTFSGSTDVVYPQWWGAKGDGKYGSSCSINSASSTLTTANGLLTASDVGKTIIVYGAGAASINLVTTISAVANANSATLAAPASTTTVAGANCVWATDDTVALQRAVNAFHNVALPLGSYGFTNLRLWQGTNLLGAGVENSRLWRLGAGTADYTTSAVAMTSGQTAEYLKLENIAIWCNNLPDAGGTAANCLELGTQTPGTTDFASASIIHNVKVTGASATGVRTRSNAPGGIENLWVMSAPIFGTALLGVNASSRAVHFDGTTININGLHVEGYYANGDALFDVAFAMARNVDFELYGNYPAKDAILITSPICMDSVFVVDPLAAATRRDVIRISTEYTCIKSFGINQPGITATWGLHDTVQSITIPTSQFYIPEYDSTDSSNSIPQQIFPPLKLYHDLTIDNGNLTMTKPVPVITLDDSTGIRPFSMRNHNNSWILREIVNAIDAIAVSPGGITTFGATVRLAKVSFANLAIYLTADGDEVFCTNCNGASDGGYTAGQVCASGPGNGAKAVMEGGVRRCF